MCRLEMRSALSSRAVTCLCNLRDGVGVDVLRRAFSELLAVGQVRPPVDFAERLVGVA